jgi:hypothetical protein
MNKWIVLLLMIGMLAVPAALPGAALADIAPPAQPPGSNLEPGYEATDVRMLAETVLLDVLAGGEGSLGKAQVTADFSMRNLGAQSERMAARFPISANDGFSRYPELKNLQVKVNGKTVPTRRIRGEDPYYGANQVPWAEFDVAFPPGEDVNIRVSYQLDGTGYYPFTSFNYILSSGAGWKDSIGSADVVVRLPYPASTQNVLLSGDSGYWFTSQGAKLQGNEVRWHFDDLEPTGEDNLRVELVAPSLWQKVIQEKANLERNAQDGEAWGRLAKAYKESAFLPKELRPDDGGRELFELSVQAYQQSIKLLPADADWHAGFAELYYWHYNTSRWGNPDDYSDALQAVELVKRAYELNRQSPKALELLQYFEWDEFVRREGESYDFLLLTATPTPQQSPTPLATLTGTATTQPTDAPTETTTPSAVVASPTVAPTQVPEDTPAPAAEVASASPTAAANQQQDSGVLSVCGVALIVPLAGAVLLAGRRWRL